MPSELTAVARALRRNATSAERRLWQGLRRKQVGGYRFRRQVALGRFVADFACLDARLIIEVDGATHSAEREIARDTTRTAALVAQGFAVLRFTNDDVYRNLDGVLETIRLWLIELSRRAGGLAGPHPCPPPP
jgi:very-short-patch-repair endonuclease